MLPTGPISCSYCQQFASLSYVLFLHHKILQAFIHMSTLVHNDLTQHMCMHVQKPYSMQGKSDGLPQAACLFGTFLPCSGADPRTSPHSHTHLFRGSNSMRHACAVMQYRESTNKTNIYHMSLRTCKRYRLALRTGKEKL